MWVCGVCLVTNEAVRKSCVCCGESNGQGGSVDENPSGDLPGQQKTNEIPPSAENPGSFTHEVEQYKVENRIRMTFKHEDLKHTTLFMSGSGEMEQIPYDCLDRHISPKTNEVEPVYECSIPMPLKDLPSSKIQAVECGALHTAFLTSAGLVYTYGCNDMGALGRLPPKTDKVQDVKEVENADGDDNDLPIEQQDSDKLAAWAREPAQVETKFRVKEISSGDNHTLMLSMLGEVYITGGFKDTSGSIGIADYTSTKELNKLGFYEVPVKVPISEPIQSIASGENHCVCLAEGGKTIYTFGSNEFCQLIMSDDEVQNPTDTDVDVSVEANLKLLLTWPQRRRVSDIIKQANIRSANVPPKSGDENEAHGNKNGTADTKSRPQSYNTRSTTNKKIVPSARRTRGNRNVRDSNTMSPSHKSSKRGRTDSEVVTRIFTGNCTTFFQTKSMMLYGVGRNGQGEVGVGREDLIIQYPTELEFFRGVEITQLRGGQFFTAALVEQRIFTWGMLSYLGLPKEYDTRDSTEELVAPKPEEPNKQEDVNKQEESNKQEDVKMEEDDEDIPLIDRSNLLTFTCHSEDPSTKKTVANGTISTILTNDQQPVPSEETLNANGQKKMVTLKIVQLKDGCFTGEGKYIQIPEPLFLKILNDDISKIPDKIRVKVDGESEPRVFGKVANFCEPPPGYKIPEHLLVKIDPVTKKPLSMSPEIKKIIKQDYPHQQMPNSVQTLQVLNPDHQIPQVQTPVQQSPQQLDQVQPLLQVPNPVQPSLQQLNPVQPLLQVPNPVQQMLHDPQMVNHQDQPLLHRPFFQEVKKKDPGIESDEIGGLGVGPPATKRRNVKGTQLKVEFQLGIERLIKFDYTKRYNDAFQNGKATEPILLPMIGPVNSIFTGADATFAILSNTSLYSWGSSQNYILGNGKDKFFEETPQMVPSEHFPGFKVVGGAGGAQHTAFIAEKLEPLVMAR
ncbi:hypothetical protein MACK_001893 [Theileria orientalis]|uniref:RanBP2-type domain-containing protein n=1 Tax=Theileria orientalis TaxID=68886 RepID=A0A976MB49_THEOR|nr:hypothetical protein MACK_001893 [Theileria orientalis]